MIQGAKEAKKKVQTIIHSTIEETGGAKNESKVFGNLKKICNHNVKFLSLESITVKACPQPQLRKICNQNVIPNTSQWIEGHR